MKQPNEMTDREMDEALATEVMGWTVGGDMFLEPLPSISPSVEPWWDTVIFREDWQPTTNLNQAWECLGLYDGQVHINNGYKGWYIELLKYNNSTQYIDAYSANNENPARAICEAVLMAKRCEGK